MLALFASRSNNTDKLSSSSEGRRRKRDCEFVVILGHDGFALPLEARVILLGAVVYSAEVVAPLLAFCCHQGSGVFWGFSADMGGQIGIFPTSYIDSLIL